MDSVGYNDGNNDPYDRPEFYRDRNGCFNLDRVKHAHIYIHFYRDTDADHIRVFADVYFDFQQDIYSNANFYSDTNLYVYDGSDSDFYVLKNSGEYRNLYMDRDKNKHSDFYIYAHNTAANIHSDGYSNVNQYSIYYRNTCGSIILSRAIQSVDAGP